MIYKIEISQFYPNNGIETKSDIFPWDIFKSGVISFFIKKTFKKINGFQNQNLRFMTKVNPKNGNETKSDIFRGLIQILHHFSLVQKY